ncbi:MAG: tRNA (N6-threonylcarbamoyladenosine(37)-N6)-methyltransferase TrmO [bacterium]|jgi:tRNA-Thr(GGU) m(6)t(6)A37 methyltransferase TsaA
MKFELHAIGTVHCAQQWHFDAPRQSGLAENQATIEIDPAYTQALTGLREFSRLWVVFIFHTASEKLRVRPPRLARGTVGAFASRSPHRPNRIGLSSVLLKEIRGSVLVVENHDFIDGTPVVDLKPYVSVYDSFDVPTEGWLKDAAPGFRVVFLETALQKLAFLAGRSVPGFQGFLEQQLSFLPDDSERKRVQPISETELAISYRTWRARFHLNREERRCTVLDIFSGWKPGELAAGASDPWNDKEVHREFAGRFPG